MSELELYVEQAVAVKSVPELFQVFTDAMGRIGFEVTSFQLVRGHHGLQTDPTTNQWPVSTGKCVCTASEVSEEPLLKYALAESGAFFVDHARMQCVEPPLSDEAGSIMCIPLRGVGGSFALIKASAVQGVTNKVSSALGYANAIAVVFYNKFCEMKVEPLNFVDLTMRELQVLRQVAKGDTKNKIAESMGVTNHAVDFHYRNILKKYGTNRILVAVVKAMERGNI